MAHQRCFISQEINPYVNLSLEEYYLKNSEDNYFILYRNAPSVVIGKHQNLFREINASWVYEHNIKICRRLSGGGTVYQDFGNLNFSFIINCFNLEKVNYKEFTFPIVQALNSFNLQVENSDRNDLLLDGMKISGNAMHIFKNRVICHGTLLYNSNLSDLSKSLKANHERYTDKSINSVSSKVTNIAGYLPKKMEIEEFTEMLFLRTMDYLENPSVYIPSEDENGKFLELCQEKYSTWEWIYSYSPKYAFRNNLILEDQNSFFELFVEKGIITEVKSSDKYYFLSKLINRKHDLFSIKEFYKTEHIQQIIPTLSIEEFCSRVF
jgi:lipoate-protein ligase A